MSVKIVEPVSGSQVNVVAHNLAVCGRSEKGFSPVIGVCSPILGKGSPTTDPNRATLQSKSTQFISATGTSANPHSRKWMMVFTGFDPGWYRVTVEAKNANGDAEIEQAEFDVANPIHPNVTVLGHIQNTLSVVFPTSSDTVGVDDFIAYGDTTTQVSLVVLTDPEGSTVDGLELFCDPSNLQFWSVMASGSLPETGTYSLTVSDGTTTLPQNPVNVV